MTWIDRILGKKDYLEITTTELDTVGADVRRIDVRDPEEFNGELGHLGDAELVPLGTLAQVAGAWSRDAPLLLICRSGARSAQACQVLTEMGFRNVTNLKGGMLAVRAAGL